MEIVKRNGSREPVKLEKIVKSVAKTIGHIPNVDPMLIATKTISGLHDGATTTSIDYLSVQEAIGFISVEPNYSAAGAALLGNIITKEVLEHGVESFSQSIALGHSLGLINDRMAKVVKQNARKLNAAIDNSKNHNFEYFGLKTVHDRYLLRHPEKRSVIETPQYWYMRIAVGLFSDNIQEAIDYYRDALASHEYTNATPTMFNTGTSHEQLSSCYLLDSPKDDLKDIYKRYSDIALLSKFAGGIGVDWTSIRAEGSLIKGTNGLSSGIVPFLKTLDSSVRSVNQCFTPETLVCTNKGMVRIDQLAVGDEVLTTSGAYCALNGVEAFQYEGKVCEFVADDAETSVVVTVNQPQLVIRGAAGYSDEDLMRLLKTRKIIPEWLDSIDISERDVILSY